MGCIPRTCSENAAEAAALTGALQDRGFRVWFNSFIVGPSIRQQMERGLAQSDFGILLLTPEFFAENKVWTRHELDALFGLERPGEVRILPVWWKISAEEVRAHSPMLSMRSAAVLGGGGVAGIADELTASIHSLASTRSPSKRVRLQVASGFRWRDGPVWLGASLQEYDRTFSDRFSVTNLSHHPDPPRGAGAAVVPLAELARAPTLWEGKLITTIARQASGSVQVFEELGPPDDLPEDRSRPLNASIAAYVFRLTSVDFRRGELCYVHCIGPYDRAVPGMGPNTPAPDWLCWVSGLLLAFGHRRNAREEAVRAIYVAASSITFTPPTTP